MQVLEAAAGQCCGGQATIGEQFDEAGKIQRSKGVCYYINFIS